MHEGHRERIRQTYIENGINAFHDHQVLELLLTYALPRIDTKPIAYRLLERYGSLTAIFNASVEDLTKVSGIGKNAALLLKLTGDVNRYAARRNVEKTKIKNSQAAMQLAVTLFEEQRYEAVYLISLNSVREVIHIDKVSSGSVSKTQIYQRIIAETVLRHGANSVILTHNHPTGRLEPSKEDAEVTESVMIALANLEIRLDDHIIVGKGNAYSCMQDCFLIETEETEQIKNSKEA